MKIAYNLSIKKLENTSPGELVYLPRSTGRMLALVLAHQDRREQEVIIGVLDPGKMKVPGPFHMTTSKRTDAASLGTSWVLEPMIGEETVPRSRLYAYSHGALHFDETGIKLMLPNHPEDYEHSELSYNLETLSIEDAQQTAAPCASWRLWFSDEDRRCGRKPLHQFTAKPTN